VNNFPKIEWRPYLDLIVRRKWSLLIPFLLSLAGGYIYLEKTPKVYKASTMILVESQRVPRDYVPSTITEDLQNRMRTISQQVNSRTNLENIIERFDLNPMPEDSSPGRISELKSKILVRVGLLETAARESEPEVPSVHAVVGSVRSKIDVGLRANNQAFEISFQWSDPQVAAQVANALASQFIDQNLRIREEMAMGTTRFLDIEVQRLQQELQKREVALEEFNRRNMGRLPSQLQSNLNILSQLKEELSRAEDQAIMTRQEIQLISRQAQLRTQSLHAGLEATGSGAGTGETLLSSLERELQEMRNRYTEQHPEVQTLKRRIERLQREPAQSPEQVEDNGSVYPVLEMLNPDLEQLQIRLARNERRIEELRSQIRIYENRVEQTSEVELELVNLERDYNAVNDRYQLLLRRKMDAELAEQMERRQQGEQFRVIDQAVPPASPFKPDKRRIMLIVFALGLGMGGGLAYLREALDPAFYTPEEAEQFLQPQMLISLPRVKEIK